MEISCLECVREKLFRKDMTMNFPHAWNSPPNLKKELCLYCDKPHSVTKEDKQITFSQIENRQRQLEESWSLKESFDMMFQSSDFVIRFCVDAQNRSSNGYINYGRFSPQSILKHGMDNVDFFHVYKYGDLRFCEHIGNDFTGREAKVKFICGTCSDGTICKDDFGCICNVTYNHNLCKAEILAAVNCGRQGPRIISEFSIGLQPRGWEVVKNGITQKEYRKSFHNHSFESSQNSVFLYVTSTDGFSGAIEKAYIQVQPLQGLSVRVVNTAGLSIPSATETITFLQMDWKCEEMREQLYEVTIRIPIDGYDPVEFFLYKQCRTDDIETHNGISSIKMGEAVSLIILVGITLLGVIYKCKLQDQGKSDAASNVPLISEIRDEVNGREDSLQAMMEVPMV